MKKKKKILKFSFLYIENIKQLIICDKFFINVLMYTYSLVGCTW